MYSAEATADNFDPFIAVIEKTRKMVGFDTYTLNKPKNTQLLKLKS